MSILITQLSTAASNVRETVKHPRRQVGILCGFLLGFFGLYLFMAFIAMPLGAPVRVFATFMAVWGACFGLYFIASYWVLLTRPLHGCWLWIELGLIFAGAVIFRFMLVNLPLSLSGDAWRYLWDARVILNGYSPYFYAPFDKILTSLHDSVFAHITYGQFPTKYPPGAQIFFMLGYLLNPTNLVALKIIFVLLDLVTCVGLAALLVSKGLDPRRVLLYAWCPLPIIEFAIQGHSDVIAIAFMVLAVLCAQSSRKSLRIAAGICIGIAALARLYPILLLLVLVRRRDWGLIIACFTTIVLGYLPFFLLGHGDLRSVLLSFSGQQDLHPGVVALAVPVWTREGGISAKGLAIVMVWYFTFIVVGSYILIFPPYSTASNWLIYYAVSFGVMVLGLIAAAMIGFRWRNWQKWHFLP
ncbi:MAG TPA: glycosyltransferase 87 family protein [Ktedonobacteraceae bacterium]|nr:glycosyltransferase 87 family protein [Ktedonobacteraceae bacterium]